ncbi:MAG: NACHT domain-containing protein [Actinomycetales bacterium]|nr:NACHT domain-containing protein [Actinomycetales bacterium]
MVTAAIGLICLGWFSRLLVTRVSDDTLEIWANVTGLVLPLLTATVSGAVWLVRRSRRPSEPVAVTAVRLRRSVHDQWSQEVAGRGLLLPKPLRLGWSPTRRPGLSVDRRSPAGAGPPRPVLTEQVVDLREPAGGHAAPPAGRRRRTLGRLLAARIPGTRSRSGSSWAWPWSPATRTVTIAGSRVTRTGLRGALLVDRATERPAAAQLVELMADDSVHQLVLLGPAGAGKTTLAALYTLAAVEHAGPDDPVPVLVSLAGWDPQQRMEDWVAHQIAGDHPDVTAEQARRLVQDRMVVPVLDGLDEMPTACRGAAMAELERAAAAGLRTLVTCRSEEYAQIVALRGTLPQADVVEIEPILVGDVVTYLTQREPGGSTRWSAVVRDLRRSPRGVLATALSTPLMVSLARQVYQCPTTDPVELLRFTSVDAVQDHLLDRLLPSVYGAPQQVARAERWLTVLAHGMRNRPHDPDLLWWRLGRSVPRWVPGAVTSTTVMLLNAVLCPLLANLFTLVYLHRALSVSEGTACLGAGAGWGLFLGVLVARQVVRSVDPGTGSPRSPRWPAALAVGVTDILTAVAAVSGTAGLVLLAVNLCDGETAVAAADVVLRMTGRLLTGDSRAVLAAVSFVCLGAVVVTVTNGLGTRAAGNPRRCTPRMRDLGRRLVAGLGVGALIGLPWVVLGALDLSANIPLSRGLVRTAMVTGLIGIPLGVGSWLNSSVSDQQQVRSPESVLRSDRNALLAAASTVSVVTASFLGFFLWYPNSPVVVVSLASGGIGINVFLLVFLGSGAAWTTYTVARLWLAAHGRLPWRLVPFLRHAVANGVLRQAGSAYQVRHDLLRRRLESRWSGSQPSAPPFLGGTGRTVGRVLVSRRRRRVLAGVALTVSVTLLPLSALCTLRWNTAPGTGRSMPAIAPGTTVPAGSGTAGSWTGGPGTAGSWTGGPGTAGSGPAGSGTVGSGTRGPGPGSPAREGDDLPFEFLPGVARTTVDVR